MNGKRDLVSTIVLGVALVGVLIFMGAYIVMGSMSIGGNIALGLSIVALAIYVFLRPQEVMGGIKSRQALYGGNTLLMILIFIGILVAVNFVSIRRYERWDLTAEKRFSLAPESVEILRGLTSPVTILNFTSSGGQSDTTTLLDEYRAHSDKLTVQAVDPDAQPTLARQYLANNGMVVLLYGDRHVTVSNPTETEITSALLKLTRSTQLVVYFTTGHGERDLDDNSDMGFSVVTAGLERDGFQVKPLMLVTTNTIPSDASVVIVGGPHVAVQSSEADALRAYLARGGRLMVMVDSSVDTQDHKLGDAGVGGLLKDWGITLRDDLVFDPPRSLPRDPATIFAAKYGSSLITNKMGNVAAAFPGVRSMSLASPAPSNVNLDSLVQTSDQSWSAADLDALVKELQVGNLPGPGAKDAKGPLTLAAAASNSQTGGRLVVFGNSTFAINAVTSQPGNVDLFLNSVNWLAEQESQITIRPKPFQTRQLVLNSLQVIQVFGVSVVLMPLAVLVVGAIVWWRRR